MEDYSHAFHRNQASAATLSKKISNENGNGLTPKTIYDDVFGGPPKFGIPTFSSRIEDFSDIFGSFHSSRGSSIPVLDIPVPDAGDVSLDVRPSKFDYLEIFGGLNGVDFFDSHEELFGVSKGGQSSPEEVWTPAGTVSPSEGSSADTLDCAENNHLISDGVAHCTFDGLKQFNVSNHETGQRSEENVTTDTIHSSPHQAVSGVASVVDGSSPPQETEIINASSCGVSDISGNVDCYRVLLEEKNLKKTMSLPPMYSSITGTSGSDFKLQRRSHENGSNSKDIFLTISEISLRTQPCHVPPPMRPPPKLIKGESKIASEKHDLDNAIGDSPPPFFDVEVDANSSAAASAAAMKEAMEKAQARLKSAKELMERKRDGLQSRFKLELKDDSSGKARKEDNKATHEILRFRGDVSQEAYEREDIGRKSFGRQEGQKDIRTVQVAPEFEGREKRLNVGKESVEQKFTKEPRSAQESHIDNEAGEWRVEKQFYELAETDKSNASLEVLEHAKNEKKLMIPMITQKHEKSEKIAVKPDFEQREENGKKSEASNEACLQENTRILEAAKEVHELKKLEKKLKVAQEMSQCEGKEKKLKVAQVICDLEEDEINLKVAYELEEHGKMLQQAREEKENEKKLEESHEWGETEKRQRGASWSEVSEGRLKYANELDDNGKRLKESFKREEKEERMKDSCQQEESKKKLIEACKSEFNESRLEEIHDKEENDNRQKDAPDQEENEKQLKEACELKENEKRLQKAHEREENEKRLKEVCMMEENERRLKEVCKMKENEKQLKQVSELVEDVGRQRQANEGGKNRNIQKWAFEWEENENKVKPNQEAHDVKFNKNLMTATRSCNPVNDNNFEENPQALKYEDRKLKLAQEAIEHEGSGRMTEAAKDAYDCEGNGNELKKAKAGYEEDESGRSGYADVAQCAPEKDRHEKIKDFMEGLSLDEHENKLGESEIAINLEQNEKNKRISRVACDQESLGKSQVANDQEASQNSNEAAEGLKNWTENEKKTGVAQPVMSLEEKRNMRKIGQEVNKSQGTERKVQNHHETCSNVEREKERLRIEKEQEEERLIKIEEEKEWEREREKDRTAVERVTCEACERAFTEARERAERTAVERATSEARQRAMAEAQEKLEKAFTEAREKSLAEKALMEARLRAERAVVERATAAALERAAEKAALAAREQAERSSECAERSVAEKLSATNSRDSGMRQSSSCSDLRDPQLQSSGSDSSSRHTISSVHGASYTSGKFQGAEGEPARRCKARLERHQRTIERAAKALAEKNMRDLLAQREQAERNRLAETLDAEVSRWSSGKEGNLRALLSTLHYILGTDGGWQPIPLTEVITAVAVKKAYRKATLCVHPDKLQQKGASIQRKYICGKVFDLLKEAWNRFNSEER
ncbi:hypothetical protein NE237_018473 [Protea cynaroides]|uniref:J domain-containing protein n=1 Tax=Protea cynaroides TaxID=273540 RepID=A0A9Q0KA16_9MAGN|nr:hypothetical protein NE237_018473 [Protea cynaroides]